MLQRYLQNNNGVCLILNIVKLHSSLIILTQLQLAGVGVDFVFKSHKEEEPSPSFCQKARNGPTCFKTIQVRTGQVRIDQVKTGQVKTGQVRTGQVSTGHPRTPQVWTNQISTIQVKTDQVRMGEDKLAQNKSSLVKTS